MKGTVVASRYAKSLLDLSIEMNALDKINNDMLQIIEVCKESKDLTNLLNNPIVNASKKNDIFDAIFKGKLDELSMKFIHLVTTHSRESILPEIANSYNAMYKEYNHILDVDLVSAQALSDQVKAKILDKLKAKYTGYNIQLNESVNPELIGGFVITVGDKQLDASVANQLTTLKSTLLN